MRKLFEGNGRRIGRWIMAFLPIAFFFFCINIKAIEVRADYVDTKDALYTYDEMCIDIGKLAKKYPDYFSYEIAGYSCDNRYIFALTVGKKDAPYSFFVESGTHAREYINCMLTMKQVETYLKNWDKEYMNGVTYGDILSQCNLVVIPMTNPDGVTISQFGPDAIRDAELRKGVKAIAGKKATTRWKANARGVDLNRNYDCYFGGVKGEAGPSSADFNGYAPETEPEILAVESIVNAKDNWIGAVCFHSAEEAVFYNVGEAASSAVLARSHEMATIMISMNKYKLYMDERGYSKPRGLLYHWLLINKSIPTVLIETCKGNSPQSYNQWDKLVKGNLNIPIRMAYQYGFSR